MTLDEFAEHMMAQSKLVDITIEKTLLEAGEAVAETAREMLGNEHENWPALSEATLEDKARRGLPSPSPLFREGEHIHDTIKPVVVGLTLAVGSDNKVARYQEMGTSRIPPRPFLSTAMVENLPLIEEKLLADVAKLLIGSR